VCHRKAVTVIELLIVIAIVVILACLAVVAIQRVREAGARTQSANNLKQIMLACHDYATANNGRLPYYSRGDPLDGPVTAFTMIFSYCGSDKSVFVSPADPTYPPVRAVNTSSYAANGQVFAAGEPPNIRTTFRDGASNTIGFAEHYSTCGGLIYDYSAQSNGRATFAERDQSAIPITRGDPPVSVSYLATPDSPYPQYANVTFQAAPAIADCLTWFAQTPHPSGMLVAMADGSVHQLAPDIAPATYWALVTPAAGDTPGDWD
jgi:prepilin-type N-terminal cleavage/methylation domain-containing protein